jgi:hypothetical protein
MFSILMNGNINIISRSNIKYNSPIIQYIISNFFLASPIGLNPFSYTLYFSMSPLLVINQNDYLYKILIYTSMNKLINIIPMLICSFLLFSYLFCLCILLSNTLRMHGVFCNCIHMVCILLLHVASWLGFFM